MDSVDQNVRVYQELSNWYIQQGQAQMRDRFLVLAADAMHTAGRKEEAEKIRGRLLQVNPHHLFKPFSSLSEAMKSADVRNYVEGLRRTYPPEKAAQLLESVRAEKPGKVSAPPPPKDRPEPVRPGNNVGTPPAEPLKVFRLQDEKKPAPPPAREPVRPEPTPEARPAGTVPLARPVPPRSPSPAPVMREEAPPSPWRRAPVEPERPELMAGAWVATVLFWLVLLAGLAWLVFTFGGPFLAF